MWIFTTSGFVSAVSNPDGIIKVRARDRASLEPLSKKYQIEITQTPIADYPYRLEISAENFAHWVNEQVNKIEYSNFKSEVQIHRGSNFAQVLQTVWSAMHDVEDVNARKRKQVQN